MEPVSALGVAASAIQVVDFSINFFSRVKKLYKSADGEIEEVAHIRRDAQSVRLLSGSLSNALKSREKEDGLGDVDRDIVALCGECDVTSLELLEELDRVSGGGKACDRPLKATVIAIKALLRKRKIAPLQNRLEKLRSKLLDAILANMHNHLVRSSKRETACPIVEPWDGTIGFDKWICRQKRDLDKLKQDLFVTVRLSEGRLLASLESEEWRGLHRWESAPLVRTLTSSLLRRVSYKEISDREERIPEAFSRTFEWIFSDPDLDKAGQHSWSNFRDWLARDSGLYWITGKPGSGKSTLMKMIQQDERTSSLLCEWSKDTPLITAGFYFWNSGTELQMSQEGLLRSLLHQALSQRLAQPQNTPSTTSKWGAFSLSTRRVEADQPGGPWSWQELVQAFRFLIEGTGESPANFAFFIDGLDEYAGDTSKLLSFIHCLASFTNVKVCVSSRPWTVFEDAFKKQPNLMLQYHTREDISLYAERNLSRHPAFAELWQYDARYASELIESITDKASGVFLWVVLVVRSLVEGLTQGDKPAELERRLHELPGELDALFDRTLHGLEGDRFRDAAQLFRIFRTARGKPSVLLMSLADDDDHESAITRGVGYLTDDQIGYRAVAMKRRLDSRCRGLLEIAPLRRGLPKSALWKENFSSGSIIWKSEELASLDSDSGDRARTCPSGRPAVGSLDVTDGYLLAAAEVDYLHRTVKDFLTSPRISSLIDEASVTCPNTHACLFRAYLVLLKTTPADALDPDTFWTAVFRCANEAVKLESDDEGLHVKYLDALDDAATQVTRLKDKSNRTFIQRYWREPHHHWASTISQGRIEDDFYTLSVRWNLVAYLRRKFQEKRPSKGVVTMLLQTAMRYSTQAAPNDDMVKLLLAYGVQGIKGWRGIRLKPPPELDTFELSSLWSCWQDTQTSYNAESQRKLREERLDYWKSEMQLRRLSM